MVEPKDNYRKFQRIKLFGINWASDRDFIKTIRHAKRGDRYYENLVAQRSGPVYCYKPD